MFSEVVIDLTNLIREIISRLFTKVVDSDGYPFIKGDLLYYPDYSHTPPYQHTR